MNPMISYIMIVAIIILGVGLVLLSGMPVVDKLKSNAEFQEAERFMQTLDNAVKDVVREGEGSARIVRSGSGDYVVDARSDTIEFSQRTDIFDYLTRRMENNIVMMSGTDCSCYEQDVNSDGKVEMIMENSYLKTAFRKADGSYDTKDNIVFISTNNKAIYPSDSSIIVDNNPGTSMGIGTSNLDKIGTDLPKCTIHYVMNSTMNYDIYYTLYSGADFVTVEVRNIS
ncbi:MAG: hypothetical protein V1870_00595 [Candidatus Aenigmatarchaeota archaeon]